MFGRIDKQWRQYFQYNDNGVTKDRVINNYSSSMGQLQHFFDNKGSSICKILKVVINIVNLSSHMWPKSLKKAFEGKGRYLLCYVHKFNFDLL